MHQCQPQSSHAGPLITTQLLPPSLSFPSRTTTLTPLTLHFQQLQLPLTTTLTPLTLHFQQLQLPSTLSASQTLLMPMTPTTLKARRSWVTVGLELELKECLPTRVDVSLDGDNRRDSQSLPVAASRMFPVGQIFASSKQLEQVCRRFADAWAFQITHSGKKLACHFARPFTRNQGCTRMKPNAAKSSKIQKRKLPALSKSFAPWWVGQRARTKTPFFRRSVARRRSPRVASSTVAV
jgi:hypothetical protein